MGALNSAHKLSSMKDLSAYKAVFIPGGHGTHLNANVTVACGWLARPAAGRAICSAISTLVAPVPFCPVLRPDPIFAHALAGSIAHPAIAIVLLRSCCNAIVQSQASDTMSGGVKDGVVRVPQGRLWTLLTTPTCSVCW